MSRYPPGYNEPESLDHYLERLEDGEPCYHAGCLSHVSHPCEGCGRIAGKRVVYPLAIFRAIAQTYNADVTGLAPEGD